MLFQQKVSLLSVVFVAGAVGVVVGVVRLGWRRNSKCPLQIPDLLDSPECDGLT